MKGIDDLPLEGVDIAIDGLYHTQTDQDGMYKLRTSATSLTVSASKGLFIFESVDFTRSPSESSGDSNLELPEIRATKTSICGSVHMINTETGQYEKSNAPREIHCLEEPDPTV